MTQEEKVALLKEAGVWDVIGFPGCIDKLIALVAAHEREKQAKQEPIGFFKQNDEGFWFEASKYYNPEAIPLYATPVRTKDLTDDEIYECYTSDAHENTPRSFARVVIAADREKNK